jgi:phenylpropionate dioxygenase-like ring-hydroxylating dioxygenase large terminal subunit
MDTWQCAAWSDELGERPLGRLLLCRRLVLFRDAGGAARAIGARCPHRGADLARGRIVDGCIECPFHGWRFEGDGRCARVPAQPAALKIPPQARVPALPTVERDGTVWVWTGAEIPREGPLADPPAAAGPNVRRLFFAPQLVDAPILQALENAFDKAHVPFIHRGTLGGNRDPLVARQRIDLDPDDRGLIARDDPDSPWHAAPALPRGLLGALAGVLGLRPPVTQYVRFAPPRDVHVYLEYPNGTYDLFVTHFTPADDTSTWLFVASARTRAPHALGDWIQRRVIDRIFAEGKLETDLILAAADGDAASRVSVESDRASLRVRQSYEHWRVAAQRE